MGPLWITEYACNGTIWITQYACNGTIWITQYTYNGTIRVTWDHDCSLKQGPFWLPGTILVTWYHFVCYLGSLGLFETIFGIIFWVRDHWGYFLGQGPLGLLFGSGTIVVTFWVWDHCGYFFLGLGPLWLLFGSGTIVVTFVFGQLR